MLHDNYCKRSQVQGLTFRVKDKEGIEDPKSLLQLFIFPNDWQFGFKFWIMPDETHNELRELDSFHRPVSSLYSVPE